MKHCLRIHYHSTSVQCFEFTHQRFVVSHSYRVFIYRRSKSIRHHSPADSDSRSSRLFVVRRLLVVNSCSVSTLRSLAQLTRSRHHSSTSTGHQSCRITQQPTFELFASTAVRGWYDGLEIVCRTRLATYAPTLRCRGTPCKMTSEQQSPLSGPGSAPKDQIPGHPSFRRSVGVRREAGMTADIVTDSGHHGLAK
jgi:hypothetical protein